MEARFMTWRTSDQKFLLWMLVPLLSFLTIYRVAGNRGIPWLSLESPMWRESAESPPVLEVDLNSADWPELMLLPRIGERIGKRIVAERQVRGRFRSASELGDIRGVGPKAMEAAKPYIIVRGTKLESR